MNKIELDSFLNFKFLGNIQVSPDEKNYAFVAAEAQYDDNEYHHTLYYGEKDRVKKMFNIKKNNHFVFLNNDTLLLNYQRTKTEQKALKESSKQSYYTYTLNEKSLDKAFELPFLGKVEKVLSNGRLLISAHMTEADHVLYEGSEDQRKDYLKEKKRTSVFEDIDEIPYYFNGRGFKTGQTHQLFIYHIEEQSIKRLFDKSFAVGTFTLSQDKNRLYYTGKPHEKVMTFTSKIYAYDIESNTNHMLYGELDYNIDKLVDFNGQILVIAKDMQSFGLNQNPDFFMLANGEMKPLATYGQSIGNTIGTDARLLGSELMFVKDDHFYFTSTIDDHSELRRLSMEGSIETVYEMPGAIEGVTVVDDELIMIGLKNQTLQEIYRYDASTQRTKKISQINAEGLKNHYVAKPQPVVVKKENHEVKGFVLLPKDFDENKQYPAILNIHGGPKTVYGEIYYHEMQYWANEGYVVFFANPRGSDGKGNKFADIRGKYGTIDYDDLMDFTDKVIDTYPQIDETSLYVTGGSYGGFMTNWMISHTHRFKAAATQRSISNWISFYGTSDIGYFFASDQTDGHPITDLDKLYEQSPIKYVMDVKTPLLFIHSDEDYRCPMEQAQQFYAILKTNGLDTKLVWIKGENHELSRGGKPQARIKRLEEITQWFKNHQ